MVLLQRHVKRHPYLFISLQASCVKIVPNIIKIAVYEWWLLGKSLGMAAILGKSDIFL